jgi:hypothetical protein
MARELCWTNQEFFPVDIIPPWLSIPICHLGDKNRPVGGRSSETYIDMNNNNNNFLIGFKNCVL